MVWLFFTACALGQNFGAAMLGTVKRQTTTLDQHSATDDMVDHQQQEPDGDGGFKTCQQRLRGRQIPHGCGQNGHQRRGEHQVPQHAVEHVIAAARLIEIQRNAGAFKAEFHHCQRAADEDKAETAQRTGEFTVIEVIEHDQRHD